MDKFLLLHEINVFSPQALDSCIMRKSWQACDTLGDNCIISGVTWLEESFDLRIMAEWRMPTAQCVNKLGTSFVLFLEEEYILDYSMNSFNKKKNGFLFLQFLEYQPTLV